MADQTLILSVDEEAKLLQPIDEYVGKIQEQIDALRVEGSDRVNSLKNQIAITKEDKNLSKEEQTKIIEECKKELEKAKNVENTNKPQISKLIADAEGYLSQHYKKEYYDVVAQSCKAEKEAEKSKYEKVKAELQAEHQAKLSGLKDAEEIKAEKYTHKNKLFDAQMAYESKIQEIKDRRHDAYMHKYHLIDLLRMSKFTFAQKKAQSLENYKYSFNLTQFLYRNGLYIVIIMIFVALCIITPLVKNTQLLTVTNILNILQQASPRMFLALGVAGLILLTGTDLSVGRMVGMGMVTATIIMHKGINTGGVFGHVFDFYRYCTRCQEHCWHCLYCVVLTTAFAMIAGFFTGEIQNASIHFNNGEHADYLRSCYHMRQRVYHLVRSIQRFQIRLFHRSVNSHQLFLWAVAAIAVVWFIWNKTTFGKNLYAVGGNPEAAAVSGISVFKVTMGAFVLAGILYGFGSWLECVPNGRFR